MLLAVMVSELSGSPSDCTSCYQRNIGLQIGVSNYLNVILGSVSIRIFTISSAIYTVWCLVLCTMAS